MEFIRFVRGYLEFRQQQKAIPLATLEAQQFAPGVLGILDQFGEVEVYADPERWSEPLDYWEEYIVEPPTELLQRAAAYGIRVLPATRTRPHAVWSFKQAAARAQNQLVEAVEGLEWHEPIPVDPELLRIEGEPPPIRIIPTVMVVEDEREKWERQFQRAAEGRVQFVWATTHDEAVSVFAQHSGNLAFILVDGCLASDRPDTMQFVHMVRGHGYTGPMVAMSRNSDYNRILVEAGCSLSMAKDKLQESFLQTFSLFCRRTRIK